jgi:hypothetical protein
MTTNPAPLGHGLVSAPGARTLFAAAVYEAMIRQTDAEFLKKCGIVPLDNDQPLPTQEIDI